MFLTFFYREELRGITRGKDVKDVDWEAIAGADESDEDEDEENEDEEKPKPIKIAVSEVLKRVRKPNSKKGGSSLAKKVNKKGTITTITYQNL